MGPAAKRQGPMALLDHLSGAAAPIENPVPPDSAPESNLEKEREMLGLFLGPAQYSRG